MSKVHSSKCWSEMMCVPCTNDKLKLMAAERGGLASKLLDVQREAVEVQDERDLARQANAMLHEQTQLTVVERNDARREVTRLSNFETAHNNLLGVVDSQYRNIEALIGQLARMEDESDEALIERDEAQARLRKANCDYGDGWLSDDLECGRDVEPWCGKHAVLHYIAAIDRWDRLFREMEGLAATFLGERDEARLALAYAQETIDGMRAEGCVARGTLENIFNGATAAGVNHGDPTIARITSEAASTLVDVPVCEHKALAERRKKDMGELADMAKVNAIQIHHIAEHSIAFEDCYNTACYQWRELEARAAIEEEDTPDGE